MYAHRLGRGNNRVTDRGGPMHNCSEQIDCDATVVRYGPLFTGCSAVSEQYACPVTDCDYTSGSMGSVKGHITRSTSGGHSGLSGPGMQDDIDTVTVNDGDTDTDAVEQASEQSETSTTETPQFPENPDEGESDGSNDTPAPECPGCGANEIADASLVVENQGEQLNSEHVNLLQDSDYVCAHCGGVFDDE